MIWSVHNAFFRRYALQDTWTVVLNSGLLFVVLFYVYPLKFVSRGIARSVFRVDDSSSVEAISGFDDLAGLFVLYGLGFVAIFAFFSLMYRHARARKEELDLSVEEIEEASFLFRHYLLFVAAGVLSVVAAWSRLGIEFALPGWLYGVVLGPACFGHSWWSDRRDRAAAQARESQLKKTGDEPRLENR